MNSDFKDLLRILLEKGARFLIIGGYAVIRYTEPRYTKDLDLLISPTPENAAKVYAALQDFGAPLETLGGGQHLQRRFRSSARKIVLQCSNGFTAFGTNGENSRPACVFFGCRT